VSITLVPRSRDTQPGRRERRAERRRLRRLDAISTRLAELHAIGELLERSADVVRHGWVQGAWFTVLDGDDTRAVTAYHLKAAVERPVTGACMVGAVVHAAGGPAAVKSQLVQRTLDLLWHTLREGAEQPVRWCPGPHVRMMQVVELTHWNDRPGRTQGEVAGLLESARTAVDVQRGLCRTERAELAAAYQA
jgi:hypothetical protein